MLKEILCKMLRADQSLDEYYYLVMDILSMLRSDEDCFMNIEPQEVPDVVYVLRCAVLEQMNFGGCSGLDKSIPSEDIFSQNSDLLVALVHYSKLATEAKTKK